MARDGSGGYTLPHPTFTAGQLADATQVTANNADLAVAMAASIAKDGQTLPTANLPMNDKKHTGVANATARTEYAAVGQVQDGSFLYGGVAGGTADALTITLVTAGTALVAGMRFVFQAGANPNTGPATISVNGLPTVAAQVNDAALSANDILANKWYEGLYDGTAVQLTKLSSAVAAGDLVAANNLSDLASAATARTNLGLVIGTDVQADLAVPSQAEAEAGTATDERVWTAQRIKQAIAALESPSTLPDPDFESAEQTVTASTDLSVAHSLGAKPDLVQVVMICKTTDASFAVGDEIVLASALPSTNNGSVIFFNSTHIKVRTGSSILMLNGSFASTSLTLASWRYILRAWS